MNLPGTVGRNTVPYEEPKKGKYAELLRQKQEEARTYQEAPSGASSSLWFLYLTQVQIRDQQYVVFTTDYYDQSGNLWRNEKSRSNHNYGGFCYRDRTGKMLYLTLQDENYATVHENATSFQRALEEVEEVYHQLGELEKKYKSLQEKMKELKEKAKVSGAEVSDVNVVIRLPLVLQLLIGFGTLYAFMSIVFGGA